MDITDITFLSILIFAGALLYSSVGHGGASGYIAAMALFGLTPDVMKPTALVLNILVSGIAAWKYYRIGAFSWSIFFPIMFASIPFSFLGGFINVPGHIYKIIAGFILLFGAYRLLVRKENQEKPLKKMPLSLAVILGAGIGFLAGLIGVGGGIFLSPLLIFMGWASTRTTSGISALFILVNSISGILGHLSSVPDPIAFPSNVWIIGLVSIAGGVIGSHIGSRRAANVMILRLLSIVLVIAGVKLIFV
jgi:uncharacterized membrane protein YfcA